MRRLLATILLVVLTGVAGCAQRDASSEQERQGGFYSGVSGGLTR